MDTLRALPEETRQDNDAAEAEIAMNHASNAVDLHTSVEMVERGDPSGPGYTLTRFLFIQLENYFRRNPNWYLKDKKQKCIKLNEMVIRSALRKARKLHIELTQAAVLQAKLRHDIAVLAGTGQNVAQKKRHGLYQYRSSVLLLPDQDFHHGIRLLHYEEEALEDALRYIRCMRQKNTRPTLTSTYGWSKRSEDI
ncbi:hypothetical protein V494_04210 [Pseudogymnoascus sp. VKM F-4513 (FW-928)]|nr:hypothetical protein V494_04210 [Pseudogymnoascus sp. VKM F-4513 (FW-928)]